MFKTSKRIRMQRGKIIAVAGKGGTGKTALSALLIRELLKCRAERGEEEGGEEVCILAVDADPDANLPDALGLGFGLETGTSSDSDFRIRTVGEMRESLLEEKQRDATLDVRSEFEGKIAEIIVEEERFDLLVMGRPEGPGCYCPVNHILRMILDTLTQNYDYTVVDCEAGLEHLSRRTTRGVDAMLVVLDTTQKSVKTALRLRRIAEEIGIEVGRLLNVANKIPAGVEEKMKEEAKRQGLEIAEVIPFDPLIQEYDFKGLPVWDLPDDAPAVAGVRRIAERVV